MKSTITILSILLICPSALAINHCDVSSNGEFKVLNALADQIVLSIGEPQSKWPKNKVSVCWGETKHLKETEFSDRDKPITDNFDSNQEKENAKVEIQKIIEENYKVETTGIEYIGWKKCNDDPSKVSEDLIIFIGNPDAETSSLASTIGKKSDSQKKSGVILKLLTEKAANYLKPLEFTKFLALHEFGHVAGLRHEDIHPDCPYKSNEKSANPITVFRDYDSMSVMSYHFMDSLNLLTGFNFKLNKDGNAEALATWKLSGTPEQAWSWTNISPKLPKSFFEDTRITKQVDAKGNESYSFNLALSEGDMRSLKCIYVYSDEEKKRLCTWEKPKK